MHATFLAVVVGKIKSRFHLNRDFNLLTIRFKKFAIGFYSARFAI